MHTILYFLVYNFACKVTWEDCVILTDIVIWEIVLKKNKCLSTNMRMWSASMLLLRIQFISLKYHGHHEYQVIFQTKLRKTYLNNVNKTQQTSSPYVY